MKRSIRDDLPDGLGTPESGPSGGGETAPGEDLSLLEEFVSEAMEHLEAAELRLLALETNPADEEALNAVFRALHTIKGSGRFLSLDDMGTLAHEAEELLDRARKGEIALSGLPVDAVFDAVDTLKRMVGALRDSIETGAPPPKDPSLPELLERIRFFASGRMVLLADPRRGRAAGRRGTSAVSIDDPGVKLGEILVRSGKITEERLGDLLRVQKERGDRRKLGELLVTEGGLSARDVAEALRKQKAVRSLFDDSGAKESIKIDAERLDRLLDAIGELVISESAVSKAARRKDAAVDEILGPVNRLDEITHKLQEMATSLRMVPIRSTFQKMARLARDVAKESGKIVEFTMSGEDMELDRNVVDRIGDPLAHMIRNAVDHGIESDSRKRREAGKPERGRIELHAFHRGPHICIEVEDDGRGLDRDSILAQARESGLVDDHTSLSDADVLSLIFAPGFSTRAEVTDVSGRGVGMDVVREAVEGLQGEIDIQSEPGKGTLFTIRLPLTHAIIEGMVLQVGEERYIIPTPSVVGLIKPGREELARMLDSGEKLPMHDNLVPLFHLDRMFSIPDKDRESAGEVVVVVEDGGKQVGLLTDEVLGQQQIVIRGMGESADSVPGIAGAATMTDGRAGLILDIGGLVKLANTSLPRESSP